MRSSYSRTHSFTFRWILMAVAMLSWHASAETAFIAGETKGGKGTTTSVSATQTGNSPWVMFTTNLDAKKPIWASATLNLTQTGTGRVRDFQLDSTSLSVGWLLTDNHLSRNGSLTSGGSWSVKFDSAKFQQVTGISPAGFKMLQLQSHRSKAGYQVILVQNGGQLHLMRTSDAGANWIQAAFAASSGSTMFLKAGNMDACQKNNDVYVSALFSRPDPTCDPLIDPFCNPDQEFVQLFTIRDTGSSLSVDYEREVPAALSPQLIMGTADNGASCDVWLEASGAMLKSSDQGSSWASFASGITPMNLEMSGLQINERIQALPDSATSLFSGVLGLAGSSSSQLSFAHSSNGFASFSPRFPSNGGGVLRQGAFAYTASRVLQANFSTVAFTRNEGDSMTYMSDDSGASWKGKSNNLKDRVCSVYGTRNGFTCFQVFPVSVRVQP